MPVVEELIPPPDPEGAFLRLADKPHCLFLDSALRHPELGRYSFVTADPFDFITWPVNDTGKPTSDGRPRRSVAEDGLGRPSHERFSDTLSNILAQYRSQTIPGLPPFQGGAAGLFSYDLSRRLERLPPPRFDEFQIPALAVALYDVTLAFDHFENRAWIVSQGWPESDATAREKRARRRLCEFREWLATAAKTSPAADIDHLPARAVTPQQLVPQFSVPGPAGLTSNFSRPGYLQAVERAIEYIAAGDVFQVNLAQRLLFPACGDSIALYQRLRRRNPATFAGYFDLGDFQIVSASPERFLQVREGRVEARPIKGTRRRTRLPEADLFAGDDLRASEKDRAENVMIVDLLRNDLSRVCRPESLHVTQLCGLETYEFVQHLVSVVRGTLDDGRRPLDLVAAAFPGGSITGAPKVRAMEIIAELEPTARGAYCGALGYLGFDGALDTSILIRTITAGRGWWQAPVGGGIVAPSSPELEYEETWHKAEGLLRALV